jgi:hypothetical protein
LKTDASQKWKDLVNGVSYDGKVWKGLNYQEGSFKVSILAYYTYWNWLNDKSKETIEVATTNATNINQSAKAVQIWNIFVAMYQGVLAYSTHPLFTYKNGVTFIDYYKGATSGYVSLVEFLNDKKADYPTATPFIICNSSNSNRLGL